MRHISIKPLKGVLLCCALFSLAGCVSGLKRMDLTLPQHAAPETPGKISIDQLLAQARIQQPETRKVDDLYLQFEMGRPLLNPSEEKQILIFARQQHTSLFLSCAPGLDQDRFSAAFVAIQRCQNISSFLRKNSVSSEVLLSPGLQPDQVRIYR